MSQRPLSLILPAVLVWLVTGCINPGGDIIRPPEITGASSTAMSDPSSTEPTSASYPGTTASCMSDACSTGSEMSGDITCSGTCGTMSTTGEGSMSSTSSSSGCFAACESRYVFATYDPLPAKFGPTAEAALENADFLCQTEGDMVLPGRSWRAWLANDVGSPAMRFDTGFTGNYILFDNGDGQDDELIATGWTDLSDGTIARPINRDRLGQDIQASLEAWTGVDAGGMATFDTCSNWTSTTGTGTKGSLDATDSNWSNAGTGNCMAYRRMYCFEDHV